MTPYAIQIVVGLYTITTSRSLSKMSQSFESSKVSRDIYRGLHVHTYTYVRSGVNPGGWGVATQKIFRWGSWGCEILLYPIM